MKDILCIYHSRTGNTRKAIEEIAKTLDAEVVEITDGIVRTGTAGFVRSGCDAMRHTTLPLEPFQTERPLEDYRLVIIGTPLWAGRCSSVTRQFLKRYGRKIKKAAFVVTRGSNHRSTEVFEQMERYVPAGSVANTSLRLNSVGYDFWRDEFLRDVQEYLR